MSEKPDEDLEIQMSLPLKELVAAWTQEYWGPRCPEWQSECPCCKAWAAFDTLFETVGD